MSIFVSWSGPSNRDVARKVKQFVSEVLGTDSVFMSDEDIAPGDKSLEEVDLALKKSTAALVIVSARSMREPWLNFEAGAMAVRLTKTSVIPILLDLTFSQLVQPIAQFQAIRYDDAEKFRRTLGVLNAQRGADRIKSETLDIVFEARWPSFQDDVRAIIAANATPEDEKSLPDEADKIDEILATLRGLASGGSALSGGGLRAAGWKHEELQDDMDFIRQHIRSIIPVTDFSADLAGRHRRIDVETTLDGLEPQQSQSLARLAKQFDARLVVSSVKGMHIFTGGGKWNGKAPI